MNNTIARIYRSAAHAHALIACAATLLAMPFPPAHAQPCGPQWLTGEGIPGTDSFVYALTSWDPDGPGPHHPVLVIGGFFSIAGDSPAQRVATFDPITRAWAPLGNSLGVGGGWVNALAVAPDGTLLAAGSFVTNGTPSSPQRIARWSGATWSHIGADLASGLNGTAFALAVDHNDVIYAGGDFTSAGGNSANRIAAWNGSAWSSLGSGTSGTVRAIATMPNGDVIAAGSFLTAGAATVNNIARWSGAAWSSISTGLNGPARALHVEPNGDLIVAGSFTSAGGVPALNIARWNGATWSALGAGIPGDVRALTRFSNGDIIAAGLFNAAGPGAVNHVARWNGATWLPLGAGLNKIVHAVHAADDLDVFAAGEFTSVNELPLNYIARWQGASWDRLSDGLNGAVTAAALTPDGDLLIAAQHHLGQFTPAVLRYNGAEFTPLGPTANGSINKIIFRGGQPIAAGWFTTFGAATVNRIALWNGADWTPLASGIDNGVVNALALTISGDLIVGGSFTSIGGAPIKYLARWNGAHWSAVAPDLNGDVNAILILPNGHIVVGGAFTLSGGVQLRGIGRWDGEVWQAYISQNFSGFVYDLARLNNGDMVATGNISFFDGIASHQGIARWNGAAWTTIGSTIFGNGTGLALLPNGDLILSGSITLLPATTSTISRWNGVQWSRLGDGLSQSPSGLIWWPKGELFAFGSFNYVNPSIVSRHRARWTETNAPWLARQPQQQVVQLSDSATFSATPAHGYANLSATWQLESAPLSNLFVTLTDGPIPGAEPASATITQLLPTIRPGATTLAIADATSALHNRRVRVLIENACAGATSNVAGLYVGQVPCPGDVNGDRVVNFADLNIVLSFFGQSVAPGTNGDLNNDGSVNFVDLNILLSFFGTAC